MWGAIGKNYAWISNKESIIGYILITISVIFSAFVYFRTKGKEKVYFTAAVLVLCSYMLSVKMNERYAFAAIIFLLLTFIEKPTKNNAISYFVITLSQFFNIAWVLFVFETDFYKYYPSKQICVYSAINVIIFAFIIYVALKDFCGFIKSKKEVITE
jgi:hypothetical protein